MNPETPSDPALPTERHYDLDELATLAGVSSRTVRFYIQEGLVSRPQGARRGAYYLPRHLEQLLLIRRWTDAGISLDRVRELLAGAPDEPPPRASKPGTVEVWSHVTLADGLEIHIEPGRAGLSPEQVRALVRGALDLYRAVRAKGSDASAPAPIHASQEPTPSGEEP